MESKMRYFIVVYVATVASNNAVCTGQCNMEVKGGGYLVRSRCVDVIQKLSKGEPPLRDVVITNIIELSESDYRNWRGEN